VNIDNRIDDINDIDVIDPWLLLWGLNDTDAINDHSEPPARALPTGLVPRKFSSAQRARGASRRDRNRTRR
jgi:hypothetical protein